MKVDHLEKLLEWAVETRAAEVDSRPRENIYKSLLNRTWNQMIRRIKRQIRDRDREAKKKRLPQNARRRKRKATR